MQPVRVRAVEKRIEGQPVVNAGELVQFIAPILQAGMADFNPPSDFRASNGYRRVSGLNLAFRALEEAINISRQPVVSL
jgi:CO/xanthine dehydrogenase FAD-binding subunit